MIRVRGWQQAEISTEETINHVCRSKGAEDCLWDRDGGNTSTDGHCRSHNTAAGCCVTSEEAVAAAGMVAGSVLVVVAEEALSSESEMGASSGEMEAGSTVPSCSGMRMKSSMTPVPLAGC